MRVGREYDVVNNRLDCTFRQGAFPTCLHHDLGVLDRVPLTNGYLNGQYRPDDPVRARQAPRRCFLHHPDDRLVPIREGERARRRSGRTDGASRPGSST